MDETDTRIVVQITDILDAHSLGVEVPEGTVIAASIFVLGQEVDNFNTIKKDAIFTITTAALQEVDRQLQAEKAKVATLETQMAAILARLDALESA